MSAVSNLTNTDGPRWDTSDNHGPLVNVLTWFFVVMAFFSVLARVATRFAVVRQIRWDDATLMFAMVRMLSDGWDKESLIISHSY